jgi:hypothetical protein
MTGDNVALPSDLVRRPDGSYVSLSSLEPRDQLAHELVMRLFSQAETESDRLRSLKQASLIEMRAFRDMMFGDYGLTVTGSRGGFSIKSVDGTKKVEMAVNQSISFGPELSVARELLNQFLTHELEGSSEVIEEIVTSAFRVNDEGKVNVSSVLALRKHRRKFSHYPLWAEAMDVIEKAILRDPSTYIRFYRVDPETKAETMVPLDIAKVSTAVRKEAV